MLSSDVASSLSEINLMLQQIMTTQHLILVELSEFKSRESRQNVAQAENVDNT